MKKKKNRKDEALFCAILAALIAITMICGCAVDKAGQEEDGKDCKLQEEEPGTFPGLGLATEKRIIQDYFDSFMLDCPPHLLLYGEYTVEDFYLTGYYGTYNGVAAIMMGGNAVHCAVPGRA